MLVGRDFRFGARGAGDVDLLSELGADVRLHVDVVDDVHPETAAAASRRPGSASCSPRATCGTRPNCSATLRPCRARSCTGRSAAASSGFPTANLSPESEGLIPADGVYAGWLTDAGTRYPAAISVGDNPTFEGVPKKQVEAYVLDRELDLYGHVVDIEFVERIRGMVAFTNIPDLIDTIRSDVDRSREILGD